MVCLFYATESAVLHRPGLFLQDPKGAEDGLWKERVEQYKNKWKLID